MRITLPPALQYRDYRRFWLAMLSAVGGFQILIFGQFWLIHELTGSTLYLGYVGLASAIPAITLNLVGGVVADRFDKVRLITFSQTASAMLVLLLALLTVSDVVQPSWRASAAGVYRLWRDMGYAVGALLAGGVADAFGLAAATLVTLRMGETFRSGEAV